LRLGFLDRGAATKHYLLGMLYRGQGERSIE
jgi:hypothetical protein